MIDEVWLATAPLDMRAGTDSALALVITVFGAAHPHHAYLFANKRANRLKILVHDSIGIWLAARRLHHCMLRSRQWAYCTHGPVPIGLLCLRCSATFRQKVLYNLVYVRAWNISEGSLNHLFPLDFSRAG